MPPAPTAQRRCPSLPSPRWERTEIAPPHTPPAPPPNRPRGAGSLGRAPRPAGRPPLPHRRSLPRSDVPSARRRPALLTLRRRRRRRPPPSPPATSVAASGPAAGSMPLPHARTGRASPPGSARGAAGARPRQAAAAAGEGEGGAAVPGGGGARAVPGRAGPGESFPPWFLKAFLCKHGGFAPPRVKLHLLVGSGRASSAPGSYSRTTAVHSGVNLCRSHFGHATCLTTGLELPKDAIRNAIRRCGFESSL